MVPSIENRKDDINDLVIEFLKESLSIYDLDIDNISNDAIIFFSNLDSVKSVSQLKKFIQWSVFMFSESNKIKISKDDIIKLLNSFLSNSNNNLNSDFLNLDLKNAREFLKKSI